MSIQTPVARSVRLDQDTGYNPAMPEPLHAPWRMDYIKSLENKHDDSPGGCFLCDGHKLASDPEQRRRRLILWASEHSIVLLNKFPYTSGHLLVAPAQHLAELNELNDAELLDMEKQSVRAIELLKKVLNPHGFNLGINLGRAAGAGLPGHLHRHIVPRWNGDTNFMSVLGNVRIIPQAWEKLWEDLVKEVPGA